MGFSSDIPQVTNQISQTIDVPMPSEPTFRPYMTNQLKRLSDSMNSKEGALYMLQELASFQQWYTLDDPNTLRPGYRTTYDLVALWGAPIPNGGTTAIPIPSTMFPTPAAINGIVMPTHGFGAAIANESIYYFINDPQLYVRFNNTVPAAQVIEITNMTGFPVTSCLWVMEYVKQQ